MIKITPDTMATFLSLPSSDFLLPYSLAPDIHQIPNPIPPLGDISRTDPTKTIPAKIMRIIRNVRILINKKKDKQSVYQRYKFP